jgi:hypothetical protein
VPTSPCVVLVGTSVAAGMRGMHVVSGIMIVSMAAVMYLVALVVIPVTARP